MPDGTQGGHGRPGMHITFSADHYCTTGGPRRQKGSVLPCVGRVGIRVGRCRSAHDEALVLKKIAQGLRSVHADPEYEVAGKAAISYRRHQLGALDLATAEVGGLTAAQGL